MSKNLSTMTLILFYQNYEMWALPYTYFPNFALSILQKLQRNGQIPHLNIYKDKTIPVRV